MQPAFRPAVLLVDDDLTLLSVLSRRLAREGMDVSTAPSGNAALAALDRGWPALLVVDLMMPGMDGFELCRRVKRIADLPIIVLSSVDASEAKVRALEEYAEDYITKPFDPDELVARINRVMRRPSSGPGTLRLDDGELELDLAARKAVTPAGTQQLTPTEVRLLQVLVANIDRPVSTEMLLDRVWSDADGADPSYVWVSMRRLPRTLDLGPDHPRYLPTAGGVGSRRASAGRGQRWSFAPRSASWHCSARSPFRRLWRWRRSSRSSRRGSTTSGPGRCSCWR
jgi:two-component system KDP operon response regulator KdpE